ncbi:MAG: hypothetical protein IJ851_03205, partial [Eubacterium sp.]|nr:hypothetical protein [Eubacterium sp.]
MKDKIKDLQRGVRRKECQPENGIFFAITVLKITARRQPCGDFMLCSNKKYAHFQVRGSFG